MSRVPPGVSDGEEPQPTAAGHDGPPEPLAGPGAASPEAARPEPGEGPAREQTDTSETPLLDQAWSRAAFPRAEAFLGRPVELHGPEDGATPLAQATWLFHQRRVEAALRLLPPAADAEAAVLRVRCLVALRRHATAGEELSRLADTLGEKLPFQARLLAAQMPLMQTPADPFRAMGMLQALASTASSGLGSASPFERLQLLRLLSHAALCAGHGDVAAATISSAAMSVEGQAEGSQLFALMGRHFAAAGDVVAAEEAFDRADAAGRGPDSASALLDRGLLLVAQGSSESAREVLERAASATRAALDEAAQRGPLSPWSAQVDEVIAAESNLAVCRLPARQLREAVSGLEALVRRDPTLFLRQSVAQNLSSLYEFLPDCKQRRAVLRELVDAFQLVDIEPKSFEQPGA